MTLGFNKGETALVLAARQNRLYMLQVLLDAGASLAAHELALPLLLTHTAPTGQAALSDSLQALRDAGLPSLTTHEEQEYLRLLNQAYRKQASAQTLCWLIERGARTDPWPNEDRSGVALHKLMESALSQEDCAVVLNAMLEAGGNPDAANHKGQTPGQPPRP